MERGRQPFAEEKIMSVALKCCVNQKCLFVVKAADLTIAVDKLRDHLNEVHRPLSEGDSFLELHCIVFKPKRKKEDGF